MILPIFRIIFSFFEYLQATSLIFILPCAYGLTINTPTSEAHPKSSNNQDKRSLLFGDLSYSYSATDIGSDEGSHVKTITVIKNIGQPKFHRHHPFDEWDTDSRNRFNFVFKFPEFPDINSGTFFHKEKPRKVIPTKQPTDRQTPVFDTEFDTKNVDDQPNVNVNTNNDDNVPPVSESSPEALPDPMIVINTENSVTKEPSDEVEYIQTDGEQSKSTMPTPAMIHSKKVQSSRTSTNHGYRTPNVREKTSDKRLQGHRQSSDFIEDFSDYSMHNVQHLVDPMKVKDSLLKYTQNQSNVDLKKLTNIEPTEKDKKFDSYGNVIQKSQSLLDASPSSPYRNIPEANTQPSSRPYISPSLKKSYNSPSQSPPKIASTTSSKGLTFFSTTQKAYVAPKKSKLSEKSNPDKSFIKPSTESIQQPMYSLQLNLDNNQERFPEAKFEQNENHNSPLKQLNEEKKPEQQFRSYSIRNPLTTSLPVQHNSQEPLKLKLQPFVAVPLGSDMPSIYLNDASKQHHPTMPKRYVRHHVVFDSKPPYSFMESPFQPVKAILMG